MSTVRDLYAMPVGVAFERYFIEMVEDLVEGVVRPTKEQDRKEGTDLFCEGRRYDVTLSSNKKGSMRLVDTLYYKHYSINVYKRKHNGHRFLVEETTVLQFVPHQFSSDIEDLVNWLEESLESSHLVRLLNK